MQTITSTSDDALIVQGRQAQKKINSMLKNFCHLINTAAVTLPLIAIQ